MKRMPRGGHVYIVYGSILRNAWLARIASYAEEKFASIDGSVSFRLDEHLICLWLVVNDAICTNDLPWGTGWLLQLRG